MRRNKKYLAQEYIGFDDRKFMIGGIFIIAFVLFPVFSGMDLATYYKHALAEVPEGFILSTFFWLFYRYVTIRLRKKFPKIEDTKKRVIKLLLLMLIVSPIIGKLLTGVTHLFIELFGMSDCVHMGFVREIIVTYFLSFSVLATYEAIYFFVKYKEALQEKERLQTAHVQSELDNLRNQINPHFLFNSLNTLMNLIPKDSDRAVSYLGKLSKFYRYSVGKHEESLVPLSDELENAKLYGALLAERFGDNITIEIQDVDSNAKVVPLSLQLMIENAVKHNVVSKNKPLHILVKYNPETDYVYIKNNLQIKIQQVSSTGVGLANITKRYSYFTDKEVIVEKSETEFRVGIPLIYKSTISNTQDA
tara:strand:- start:1919 stop:3004 length:1086 start_codon:yes stop_codon:yes gene_type:complete